MSHYKGIYLKLKNGTEIIEIKHGDRISGYYDLYVLTPFEREREEMKIRLVYGWNITIGAFYFRRFESSNGKTIAFDLS